MAQMKTSPYLYPDSLSGSTFPALQAPKGLSRLEVLRNEYQERNLCAKEEKMVMLLTQQQERIIQRLNGTPSKNKQPQEQSLWAPEERAWASNWTVTKRTTGVDRAHPLKPVYHRQTNLHPASATGTHHKQLVPVQAYNRSKSSPAHPNTWIQLEKKEFTLEAEIRRKEAILREKLQRTEEELRRIQKERDEAELEERKEKEAEERWRKEAKKEHEKGKDIGRRADRTVQERLRTEAETQEKWSETEAEERRGQERTRETKDQRSQDKWRREVEKQQRQGQKTWMEDSSDENRGQERWRDAEAIRSRKGRPQKSQAAAISDRSSMQKVRDTHCRTEGEGLHPELKMKPNRPASSVPADNTSHWVMEQGEEAPGGELEPCQLCGRRFLVARLEKHAQACQKMQTSKRKVFDSSKARAKGTDLEQFLCNKGRSQPPAPQVKSSSWRPKQVVQNAIAKGGKLSGRPPPPPENPNYVTCPHCTRRFAPRAAERHIPKCETIKNKPRPPPACHHRR